MKRLFSLLVAGLMLFAVCPLNASAAEAGYVSFEEYSAAIEAEFEKYGIEGGVYEPDGEFMYTYEDLEADLNILHEYLENKEDSKIAEKKLVGEPIISGGILTPPVMPMATYVTVTMTSTYFHTDVSLPIFPRFCTIKTKVNILTNRQNSTIVSVSKPSLSVENGVTIDDWIEYVNHQTWIDQAKKRVTMSVTCKLKYSLTILPIPLWEKATIDYITVFKDVPC